MAKSPQAGTYVRLTERESQLLALMDGTHTVKQIVLADFVAHKSLAFDRVLRLVSLLHAQSFLTSRSIPTYDLVRQQLTAPSAVRARFNHAVDILFGRDISIHGVDAFVTGVYRSGGWLLLTWPALVLFAVIALAGLAVFERERHAALPLARALTGEGWLAVALALALFLGVSIFIHEMAHALTCKKFGREVRRGGFMLFFGFPAFFVDTTDIWLEARWKRIAVSAAGACADAVVAGLCALVSLVLPPEAAALSLAFATMTYGIVLLNLFPLLELDGYYILLDLLETPNLRQRSFAFVRERLLGKLWRRERFTREETIFAMFGLLAGAYTIFFVVRITQFWNSSIGEFLTGAMQSGNWGTISLGVLVAGFVVVAVIVKLLAVARTAAGAAERGARTLFRAARHAHLHPRERLLARIPMLAELTPAQRDVIAAEMKSERYRAGTVIIRQGDRGDRFFLIVHGTVEVLQAPGYPVSALRAASPFGRVAVLGPGDYFGELALLHDAPWDATVRALSQVEVLELTADDFELLVGPTWECKERMQGACNLRDEVSQSPLFEHLSPAERDLLVCRFQEESFEPGELILRQGDEGDRFYVLCEGHVQVRRSDPGEAERILADLGPGQFFGEQALLHSAPRDASVVATTSVRGWSLERDDFEDVLRHYLGKDALLQATARERAAEAERVRPVGAVLATEST